MWTEQVNINFNSQYFKVDFSRFSRLKIIKILKILSIFSKLSKKDHFQDFQRIKFQYSRIISQHFSSSLGQAGKLIEPPRIISYINLYRFSYTFNWYVLLSEYLFYIREFSSDSFVQLNISIWTQSIDVTNIVLHQCHPWIINLESRWDSPIWYWGADEEINKNQRSNWLQEVKCNWDQGNQEKG